VLFRCLHWKSFGFIPSILTSILQEKLPPTSSLIVSTSICWGFLKYVWYFSSTYYLMILIYSMICVKCKLWVFLITVCVFQHRIILNLAQMHSFGFSQFCCLQILSWRVVCTLLMTLRWKIHFLSPDGMTCLFNLFISFILIALNWHVMQPLNQFSNISKFSICSIYLHTWSNVGNIHNYYKGIQTT
jgi:hypothetical protein